MKMKLSYRIIKRYRIIRNQKIMMIGWYRKVFEILAEKIRTI